MVVRGWQSDYFTDFSVGSLEEGGCTGNQKVCAHGKFVEYPICLCLTGLPDTMTRLIKGKANPYEYHTLRELVERADDPTVCYNLLELTPSRLGTPFWLP